MKRASPAFSWDGIPLIVISIVLVLLLGAFVFSGIKTFGIGNGGGLLRRTQSELSATLLFFIDEETGMRGFTITRKTLFLEPYNAAQAQLPATLRALQADARELNDERVLENIAAVRTLHDRWLREVARPLIAQSRPAEADLTRQELGKGYMDLIRGRFDRLHAIVEELSAARQSRLRVFVWEAAITIGGLAIALIFFAVRSKRSDTLQTIVEASPSGVLLVDTRGRITLANAQAEILFGYPRDDLLALPIDKLVPERFRGAHAALRAEFAAAPRAREMGSGRDLYALRQDGTEVPVEIAINPITTGGKMFTLAVVTDITERKAAEELRLFIVDAQLQATSLEAEKLKLATQAAEETSRAKSEFLANMSHEIRTPMNGIIGLTTLLLDGNPTPEQQQHLVLLADAGRSLLAIINDILDLSKVEAGKLQLESIPFQPADVVRGALELVRGSSNGHEIALDATIAAGVPAWVIGDPTRLRQVLLNLLTNALKFTERGRVEVSVSCPSPARGDLLRFEVSDTGIGIDPEKQHLLFGMFSQIDRSDTRKFGGSGLGLAISRRLAEAMSGTIGVTSALGFGSVFWFTAVLPRTAAPAGLADNSQTAARRPARRILVVDDNPLNQIVAKSLLAKDGHVAVVVANGAEAVAMAQERSFDLILMDMQMPVMDGIEATRRIRAFDSPKRDVPIVALSANVLADQVASCRAAGMNDHLAKPIDREQLRGVVATWTDMPAQTPTGFS